MNFDSGCFAGFLLDEAPALSSRSSSKPKSSNSVCYCFLAPGPLRDGRSSNFDKEFVLSSFLEVAAGGGEGSYFGGDFFFADLGLVEGTESLIRLSLHLLE